MKTPRFNTVTLRAPAVGSDPRWYCSVNGVELLGVLSANVETKHDALTVVRIEFYAHVNTDKGDPDA